MPTDPAAVRERAWIEHRRPAVAKVDEPMWVAEDPVTDCVGVGTVEAEAVGNLVAVVAEYEGEDDALPQMKLPGRVVTRPSARVGGSPGLFERLRSLL